MSTAVEKSPSSGTTTSKGSQKPNKTELNSQDLPKEEKQTDELLRKKTSGSDGKPKKKFKPKPPPHPKPKRDPSKDDIAAETGLLVTDDEPAFQKTRAQSKRTFSFGFFGSAKSKEKKEKKGGRGSFTSFFARPSFTGNDVRDLLDKPTLDDRRANFEELLPTQEEVMSKKRENSINMRRRQTQSLTRSLEMDYEIFKYLREREPSLDEEIESVDDLEPIQEKPLSKKELKKQKKLEKQRLKEQKKLEKKAAKEAKKQEKIRESMELLDVGFKGAARVPTMTASLELQRREDVANQNKKKPGFFRRFFGIFSFRSKKTVEPSYAETNAAEVDRLFKENFGNTENEEELFRKDSDLTDLSGDGENLLVTPDKNTPLKPLKALTPAEEAARNSSRLSAVYEDDDIKDKSMDHKSQEKAAEAAGKYLEEKEKARMSNNMLEMWDESDDEDKHVAANEQSENKDLFLGSAMTHSSSNLQRVALSSESDEQIRAKQRQSAKEKAFTLADNGNKKVRVVNTGSGRFSSEAFGSFEDEKPPPLPPLPPAEDVNLTIPPHVLRQMERKKKKLSSEY